MKFNSFHFLVFFPLVLCVYFMVPHRYRWLLLLAASYYFYMCWEPGYALLIAGSTLVDHWAALAMGKEPEKRKRRKYLAASLIANLGILFVFKYFDFFRASLGALFAPFDLFQDIPGFDFLLPVGISFYTFQTLSYTIEVYRGTQAPERHLGYFALYVSFFPQLVAGPIERASRLLPQLRTPHVLAHRNVFDGLKLMAFGFFKKLVLADRLALFVNPIYDHPEAYGGPYLAFATVAFAFQIYCDFSGYSDIAIGAARTMGIDLIRNFDRPYFASSVGDFWRRWHISLSEWFRDYVYIPMGGSRVRRSRHVVNLLVVFAVSGLWHGASWTFVVWGLLHGGYLVVAVLTARPRAAVERRLGLDRLPAIRRGIHVAATFTLVCFAWIFFRAHSLPDALYITTHLFQGWNVPLEVAVDGRILLLGLESAELWIALFAVLALLGVHALQEIGWDLERMRRLPVALRWSAYQFLLLVILLFGEFNEAAFIYFQF